jgi:hypothetical protein
VDAIAAVSPLGATIEFDGRFEVETKRGEIATLVVVLTFLVTGVATGALSEAGKDLYKFAKGRLSKLMNKKKAAVAASTGDYRAGPPKWEIRIDAVDPYSQHGFSASIEATHPKVMIDGAAALSRLLEAEVSHWDLSQGRRVWTATENAAGNLVVYPLRHITD